MGRNILLGLAFIIFLFSVGDAQQKHRFQISNGEFVYDGKPIQIHSGEMHFARIPREYWRHRLRMLKAMGMNTVCTYVFWNYHNIAPGVWDFKTERRNIAEFIKIAQQEKMMVILRPGPYACAEWEFGGYPWWLQNEKNLVIRANNIAFLDSCKTYITKLAEQVKSLQITHGGPIIMVQVENEFGSYVAQRKDIPLSEHRKYLESIASLLKQSGFDVPFFTSDGLDLFAGGHVDGVLPTANGEDNIVNLKKVVDKFNDGKGPYMVAEYYPGWLCHWGEAFPKVSDSDVTNQLTKYLDNKVSFNIYMAHGGTNFGFTSGANYDKEHPIQPDITSYDYDAPITEAGWATPKFMAIRKLMQEKFHQQLPAIPLPISTIFIPPVKMNFSRSVFSLKDEMTAITSDSLLSFEDLDQGHGYVVYSRIMNEPLKGLLKVDGLRDFAVILVNGKSVGSLNRQDATFTREVDLPANAKLDILVEDMGRINYGAKIIENRKGIISPVYIGDQELKGNWQIFKFPFSAWPSFQKKREQVNLEQPALYNAVFNLNVTGDSFLDMSSWGKGIVFVNGINLGRYWGIGPQQTLYLPGVFLKKGKNDIAIFEELKAPASLLVQGIAKPVLTVQQQFN